LNVKQYNMFVPFFFMLWAAKS